MSIRDEVVNIGIMKRELIQRERIMENQKVEISGVKGMNSKPFRKVFKSEDALEKWMEKNGADVEVLAYSYID